MPSNKNCKHVNGEKLRELRLVCGWTQKDLARHAGYSERLIRKAEGSGSLNFHTIRDLADVFCAYGLPIKVEQLVFDQLQVAKMIVQSLESWDSTAAEKSTEYLSNDLEIHSIADCSKASFTGNWIGPKALHAFLDTFFSTFSQTPGILSPVYLSTQNLVVARIDEATNVSSKSLPKLFVNLHMHFNGLMIVRIDYECSFRAATSKVQDARKHGQTLQ